MSKFLTNLDVEELDDTWRLTADFQYQSDLLNRVVTVPQGFVTDFASVPRLPLAFWLCGDTAHKPAVLHDYYYRTVDAPDRPDRETVDDLFLEAMEVDGIGWFRRKAMYRMVRLFGGGSYQ